MRRERHDAVDAGARQIDLAGKWPGGGLLDAAAPGQPRDARLGDIDGERTAPGADQAVGDDGAIVRPGVGDEAPASASGGNPRCQVARPMPTPGLVIFRSMVGVAVGPVMVTATGP